VFLDGTTWALESLKQRGIGSISRLLISWFFFIKYRKVCTVDAFYSSFSFSPFFAFFFAQKSLLAAERAVDQERFVLSLIPDARNERPSLTSAGSYS
jgi:hypothetical protein